jgi:hypothetical protein
VPAYIHCFQLMLLLSFTGVVSERMLVLNDSLYDDDPGEIGTSAHSEARPEIFPILSHCVVVGVFSEALEIHIVIGS